jgi:hypothetical protein
MVQDVERQAGEFQPPMRYPLWQVGQEFELYVYLSASRQAPNHTTLQEQGIAAGNEGALLWHEKRLFLNSGLTEGNSRILNITLNEKQIPQPWRNESVYAHIFFVRNSANPMKDQGTEDVHHGVTNLVTFAPRPKAKKKKNLISGDLSERDQEILAAQAALNLTEVNEDEIVPVWKSELYVDAVEIATAFPSHQIPLPMAQHMVFHPLTGRYYPVMHLNEFWLTPSQKHPVNATLDAVPLVLHFRCVGMTKWLMIKQWDLSMEQQRQAGTARQEDHDELKRVLLESNPYLLAVTSIVSVLHTVSFSSSQLALWSPTTPSHN